MDDFPLSRVPAEYWHSDDLPPAAVGATPEIRERYVKGVGRLRLRYGVLRPVKRGSSPWWMLKEATLLEPAPPGERMDVTTAVETKRQPKD